ncbi:hypothetical protein CDL12_02170 [Handroanthus impetiginosus]|uniref:Retrotransposon gag domain-containing protein n=1 Tax=Handroanthus impetiginosus TaxID=429701 RepID=A0A2G9I5P9_9LAMI|nr:hypothetical protein CDL12_02170 [Handroanthus impetiginosus]
MASKHGSTSSCLPALEAKMEQMEEYVEKPPAAMRLVLCEEVYLLKHILEELKGTVDGFSESIKGIITLVSQDVEALTDAVDIKIDAITTDLRLLKRAVGSDTADNRPSSSKVRVPEPKPFGGARSAKELENFLWDMENYFQAAKIPDDEKVSITSMYLVGDAKLWWRTRLADDASANREPISSWDVLKQELKEQFLPSNTSWLAREALRKLKHTGSVRDYVKEFSSLMLDIREMSEEDKLFNFMSGLQNWAQAELRRQGVKDLSSAIAAADRLLDFRGEPNPDRKKKDSGKEKGKVGKPGKKGKSWKDKGGETKGKKPADSQPVIDMTRKGCYLCGGDHRMRDCPKRAKLNAMFAEKSDSDGDDTAPSRVNPL